MSVNLNDIDATSAAKGVDMNNLPTLTAANVFDVIWDADVNRCSVSDRDERGQWRNPKADILLDKQNKAGGGADSLEDSAPRPLFHTVLDSALQKPTYSTFMQLLDNYDAVVNNIEYLNGGELDEIDDFQNAIQETDCMKICYKYITEVLGFSFPTIKQFKRQQFNMWFEIHNLRVDAVLAPTEVEEGRERIREAHRGGDDSDGEEGQLPTKQVLVKYCSGFEHVFMGEITIPDGESIGNVLGYHNWIKFYMDELTHLIDFLGTKYTKPSLSKIGAPFVCVKFRWDQDGLVFIKERGSFFVGCSPEFSIAVGTICFFETMTENQAHSNGWENKIPTKFKTKREIGGYVYEYYVCRQEKYLVSCFQELQSITDETKERQERLQAAREVAMAEALALKKQKQLEADVGITLPNGASMSRKALNRLKNRFQEEATAAGVDLEVYVTDGLISGRIPIPGTGGDGSEKKEKKDKQIPQDKQDKQQSSASNSKAEQLRQEKAERLRLNKLKGEEMQRKAAERRATEESRLAELAMLREADQQNIHIFAEMCLGGETSSTVQSASTSISHSTSMDSFEESSEVEVVALPLPAILNCGASQTLSPCHRGMTGTTISPLHTPESKPISVKPKQSATKCKEFQKFVKEQMISTKSQECDVTDKEAYRRAQENWKALGNDIKRGMGMPMIRKIRRNLEEQSQASD